MSRIVLPIGTVVRAGEEGSAYMIAGYCPQDPDTSVVYDYAAFLYPRGYADVDEVECFDHDAIHEILAMGYQDRASMMYLRDLGENIDNLKEGE